MLNASDAVAHDWPGWPIHSVPQYDCGWSHETRGSCFRHCVGAPLAPRFHTLWKLGRVNSGELRPHGKIIPENIFLSWILLAGYSSVEGRNCRRLPKRTWICENVSRITWYIPLLERRHSFSRRYQLNDLRNTLVQNTLAFCTRTACSHWQWVRAKSRSLNAFYK